MYYSQVSIDGKTYNLAHAPANKQVELVTMISSPVIQAKEVFKESDYTVKVVMFMLMGSPFSLVERIDAIVLKKAYIDGQEGVPVDMKSFQNKTSQYFELLANAILENVGDFFERLREENNLVSPESNQT